MHTDARDDGARGDSRDRARSKTLTRIAVVAFALHARRARALSHAAPHVWAEADGETLGQRRESEESSPRCLRAGARALRRARASPRKGTSDARTADGDLRHRTRRARAPTRRFGDVGRSQALTGVPRAFGVVAAMLARWATGVVEVLTELAATTS